MPRIEDKYLECPIYMYASKEDAINGERQGGSGFVVGILIPNSKDLFHPTVYAVTNQHVIEDKFTAVRINTYSGGYDVFKQSENLGLHTARMTSRCALSFLR